MDREYYKKGCGCSEPKDPCGAPYGCKIQLDAMCIVYGGKELNNIDVPNGFRLDEILLNFDSLSKKINEKILEAQLDIIDNAADISSNLGKIKSNSTNISSNSDKISKLKKQVDSLRITEIYTEEFVGRTDITLSDSVDSILNVYYGGGNLPSNGWSFQSPNKVILDLSVFGLTINSTDVVRVTYKKVI